MPQGIYSNHHPSVHIKSINLASPRQSLTSAPPSESSHSRATCRLATLSSSRPSAPQAEDSARLLDSAALKCRKRCRYWMVDRDLVSGGTEGGRGVGGGPQTTSLIANLGRAWTRIASRSKGRLPDHRHRNWEHRYPWVSDLQRTLSWTVPRPKMPPRAGRGSLGK